MRKLLLFLVFFALIGLYAKSHNAPQMPMGSKACEPGFQRHIIGKVWNVESNIGIFGDPNAGSTGNPSYDWPGGYGYYYQWEGRLWIGVKVGEDVYVSHAGFSEYEFSPSEDPADNCGWLKTGPGVSQYDIISAYIDYGSVYPNPYPLGLKVIQKSYQWSVAPYNQFIAYEFYIIYNKSNGMAGLPVTLKNVLVAINFDSDVCSYDATSPHIDDMVCFDGYTWGEWKDLKNHPLPIDTLTVLGDTVLDKPDGIPDNWQIYGDDPDEHPFSRPDTAYLCQAAYDLLDKSIQDSCIPVNDTLYKLPCLAVPRNMSYIYDDDDPTTPEDDTGENGGCPGYIFGRLIYAPPAKYDLYGMDKNGDSTRIPLVYTHSWWNWNNDPGTDENKYDYMNGTHPMDFGYRFMPIPYDVGAATFDYRFLQTYGPFEITDGETLKIVFVGGVGYGLNGGYDSKFGEGYVLGARQVADYAMDAYYMGSTHSDPSHPSAPDEDVHWLIPLPPEVPQLNYSVKGNRVELVWTNIAEVTPDPLDGQYDFAGYRIYRAVWIPSNWELLADFDSAYAAANGGYPHEYLDTTALPGIPYYYAVTAYDKGRPADTVAGTPEVPSLETGKSNYKVNKDGEPVPVIIVSPVASNLQDVKVVPNPYHGSASWEPQYTEYMNKIAFVNLPANCRITVYSVSGDKIYEVEHRGPTGTEFWNMRSRSDIEIASGIYIYKVEQFDQNDNLVDWKVGKFVVVR